MTKHLRLPACNRVAKTSAALASAVLLAACGVKPDTGIAPGETKPAVPVTLGQVARGDIRSSLTYSGDLSPKYTVNVMPKEGGRILKLDVDLGSQVKRGDVIADLEHNQLDAQLAEAQAALAAANAKLAGVQAQGRPEQVAQAQAALDAANQKLAGLQAQGRPEQVAQAQAAVDGAQQKLAALQQGRPEQIAQAQAGVNQAQAQLDGANAKLRQLTSGPTSNQVRQAQLGVEQAKDKLFADQTAYDAQVGVGSATKQQREAALAVDQTGIDEANAALRVVTDPPTADAVSQARAGVNQAQAAVDQAKQQLAIAQQPGSDQDIAQAQAAVSAAQQQLALAQTPNTAQDVGQAQAAVRGAQATVALAAKPYSDQDAAQAQAAVDQAQTAVSAVQTQIDDMTVTAPVDGVVAKRLANEGDMALPSSPLVTLASAQWEVLVQVAEESIAQVQTGMQVRMIASAFPDRPFSGTVTAVAPVIDSQTRTFTVKVEPSGTLPPLRGGMSTKIDLPGAQHTAVPLLPKGAVISQNGQNVVFTVDGGHAHATSITPGLTDDKSVEVLKGLKVGDSVVVAGQDRLEDQDPVQIQES